MLASASNDRPVPSLGPVQGSRYLQRVSSPPAGFKVFLSHSAIDADWVTRIAALVRELGVVPYLFEDDKQPGRSVGEKLANVIGECDAFIAVITVAGGGSTYLNQEVGVAIGRGIPVIPVVERGYPPDKLAFLEGIEYVPVDFADQAQAVSDLAGVIHRQVAAHAEAERKAAMDKLLLGVVIVLVGLALLSQLNE